MDIEADELLGLVNDIGAPTGITYRQKPRLEYEVLALTNGYFQVMRNTRDGKFWCPVSRELATMEAAELERDHLNALVEGSKP